MTSSANPANYSAFACFLLMLPCTCWSQLQRKVPAVVGEVTEAIPMEAGRWSPLGTARLENVETPERAAIKLTYSVTDAAASEAGLQIGLRENHLVAERLRFWLKGDRSDNRLIIWFHHKPSDRWIGTPAIAIDFGNWRHFEIPAQPPFHRIHRSFDEVKFVVYGKADASQILISNPKLAVYQPIDVALRPKEIPTPLFNSYGSPTAEQLTAGRDAGVNLHMTVVNWIDHGTPQQRTEYASRSLRWICDAGITAGLSFYGNPSVQWAATNPELLVWRKGKHAYLGPGTFTSPWNPDARALWRRHLTDCLAELKREGVLDQVELIELCPGEESEVSFNWEHTWAFDPHAIKAYQQYLHRFYDGRIDALNDDWATTHASFDAIGPPVEYYPDREHWVFTDFYRLSMLKYCVFLADVVLDSHQPTYWLWMTHSVSSYPQRFHGARYPIFYAENLRRLGVLDYAQTVANWQHAEDVKLLQAMGIKVIGELDIAPSQTRLEQVFEESQKMGMDGVFLGILETHSRAKELTAIGRLCQKLIASFRPAISK